MLNAAVMLFGDLGQEKGAKLMQLLDETEMECDVRDLPKMDMRQFLNCIDELEYYSLLKIEKCPKKERKFDTVHLNCDLAELESVLKNLVPKDQDQDLE